MYFDEVRMITNRRKIERIPEFLNKDISIRYVENEGYDFGMFLKPFRKLTFRNIIKLHASMIPIFFSAS